MITLGGGSPNWPIVTGDAQIAGAEAWASAINGFHLKATQSSETGAAGTLNNWQNRARQWTAWWQIGDTDVNLYMFHWFPQGGAMAAHFGQD